MKKDSCIIKKILTVVSLAVVATVAIGASFTPAALAVDETGEPASVAGIALEIRHAEMLPGDTLLLTASVLPADGSFELLWVSSDESVAAVDEDGVVTALCEGAAEITVSAGGFSDTCDIIVTGGSGEALRLSSEDVTMAKDDTIALDVALPEGVTPAALHWVSSAPDIAAVDSAGNVTATGTGIAEISVSADGLSAACVVTVVASQIQTPLYQIDRDEGTIKGVGLRTSVDELKAGLENDAGNIQVFCRAGYLYTTGHVGTGMTVKLVVNKDVKDELAIEIVGDVDGDGLTGVYEYSLARLHLLGARAAANKTLLDLNADGKISITDYTLIRLEMLGLNPGGDSLSGLPDVQPSLNAAALGCSAALTWGAVPSATGYELYKATSSGPFELIASLDSKTLSHTDPSLSMENTYLYRLLAYRTLGPVRIESLYSNVGTVSTPRYTVYYQGDPQWKFSSSVRKAACVVSAYAITINNMGIYATPRTVYESNGNRTPMNLTNLRNNFGVKPVSGLAASSKYLSGFDGVYTFIKSPSTNLEAAVKEALARYPQGVILYFKKGSDAHAIVACKVSGGKIYYSDPGRNRTTLVDFANTWCKVGHNMSYTHLTYMVALDRV